MKIFAFIDQYCSDLVETAKVKSDIIDLSNFPHDAEITDESGAKVQVIYVNHYAIPIMDILSLERDEFARVYPGIDNLEAYDNYVSNVTMLEGEDAVMRIRRAIDAAVNKLDSDAEMYNALGDLV